MMIETVKEVLVGGPFHGSIIPMRREDWIVRVDFTANVLNIDTGAVESGVKTAVYQRQIDGNVTFTRLQ